MADNSKITLKQLKDAMSILLKFMAKMKITKILFQQ